MNKKCGYSIVEVLAVIGIIAILVIAVVPDVVKKFVDSKKDIFVTEIKTIYDAALSQYAYDSVKYGKNITYCYVPKDSNNRAIDLIEESDTIAYYINIQDGNVIETKFKELSKGYYYDQLIQNTSQINKEVILENIKESDNTFNSCN